MGDAVKIVECPRDAWQGLPTQIPAEAKADYLRKLVTAGFRHIDAVSFVSHAAVPQMADSEQVLAYLDPLEDVEIIGIVVNVKGAERAIAIGAVQTLGFPYSISPEFLARNQRQTPEESLDILEAIGALAYKAGLDLVAYVSMAFGNPYGDAWSIEEVEGACDLLAEFGVRQISLADTVGLATPEQVAETLDHVLPRFEGIEIGVHLHARPQDAPARIRAAYEAGCRRFDAAIGGLGGCPFAQDALVGNIPTETLLVELKELGAQTPKLRGLDVITQANAEIARKFGAAVQ
ncbi:MAG: hydroxymethylglutaryl-CoA lyase [Terracidiphilus sp.]|jgi:hydroxymethylglutaryl-CoA lyase